MVLQRGTHRSLGVYDVEKHADYWERLDFEMNIIESMGFPSVYVDRRWSSSTGLRTMTSPLDLVVDLLLALLLHGRWGLPTSIH